MSNVIQCEKCGATCNLKDGFCKKCWAQLPGAEDYILDGMGQTDLEDFIDKNSKRYIDVYKKNQGKKMFLNINWAAMFFGVNWMLYRKMYKLASLLDLANPLPPTGKNHIVDACRSNLDSHKIAYLH